MFNVLTTNNPTAWETDQLMRMDAARFGEYSDSEAEAISTNKPASLKSLEGIDTLLMYETHSESPNVELVRYGWACHPV